MIAGSANSPRPWTQQTADQEQIRGLAGAVQGGLLKRGGVSPGASLRPRDGPGKGAQAGCRCQGDRHVHDQSTAITLAGLASVQDVEIRQQQTSVTRMARRKPASAEAELILVKIGQATDESHAIR